ncbi:MAG: YihY/virulence factor BrkB family protein [Bryobacterales bacterium]|nr:YihY/virulence factor BrkB family protein [Bryobacterales bacterium]MBV9399314.1 YihY/virulence factor BrkB family protein [Bryobacterales bacterium]
MHHPALPVRILRALVPTFRYWAQTEVHVYAFSIAANVLLSFFPFLIVSMSVARVFFNQKTTLAALDVVFRDYLPGALSQFLHSDAHNNLPQGKPFQLVSIVLLLFTANGIFEPLEVALNKVWGLPKNRSYLRNQLMSLGLIFACGGLAMLSLGITALNTQSVAGNSVEAFIKLFFLKIAAVPLAVIILFLVYRFLPNGKPPLHRVIPAAIGVGLLLELLKYVNRFAWPPFDDKIAREYGVFRYSVTLIFVGFIVSMLVLAGAEWSARGYKLFKKEAE